MLVLELNDYLRLSCTGDDEIGTNLGKSYREGYQL
jgi:hypothetical protein